ncbi:MAG: hypothetical protein ACFWTQ_09780 [Lactococcus sp.]|jgi:hypothetical protein
MLAMVVTFATSQFFDADHRWQGRGGVEHVRHIDHFAGVPGFRAGDGGQRDCVTEHIVQRNIGFVRADLPAGGVEADQLVGVVEHIRHGGDVGHVPGCAMRVQVERGQPGRGCPGALEHTEQVGHLGGVPVGDTDDLLQPSVMSMR